MTPIAQLRGRTDSSGNLLTALAAGTATPDKLCLDSTNQDACLQRNGAGILQLGNAATSTDFARLQFGGATSSFPSLKRSSATLQARLADDSNYASFTAGSVGIVTGGGWFVNAQAMIVATAPSALSACGGAAAPSFAWTNGTAAFEIITGGSAPVSTCTWTMPAAANKWVCDITDITTQTANVFVQKMSASSTTSVTMTNYNTAGAATAVVASDHLLVKCLGG